MPQAYAWLRLLVEVLNSYIVLQGVIPCMPESNNRIGHIHIRCLLDMHATWAAVVDGCLRSFQGLPSIMPHGMIDTPHGVDFPFSKTGMGNCRGIPRCSARGH